MTSSRRIPFFEFLYDPYLAQHSFGSPRFVQFSSDSSRAASCQRDYLFLTSKFDSCDRNIFPMTERHPIFPPHPIPFHIFRAG
jgi:hypothetical protein